MIRLLSLSLLAICASVFADYPPLTVKLTPIQVAPRVYYVQGTPGVASAANEAFNSNAGRSTRCHDIIAQVNVIGNARITVTHHAYGGVSK